MVAKALPQFHLGGSQLQFVPVFKYLGYMITNDQYNDIKCETSEYVLSYQFAYSSFS